MAERVIHPKCRKYGHLVKDERCTRCGLTEADIYGTSPYIIGGRGPIPVDVSEALGRAVHLAAEQSHTAPESISWQTRQLLEQRDSLFKTIQKLNEEMSDTLNRLQSAHIEIGQLQSAVRNFVTHHGNGQSGQPGFPRTYEELSVWQAEWDRLYADLSASFNDTRATADQHESAR